MGPQAKYYIVNSISNNDPAGAVFGDSFEGLCRAMLRMEGSFDQIKAGFPAFQEREGWKKVFGEEITPGQRKSLVCGAGGGETTVGAYLDKTIEYLYGFFYDCFMEAAGTGEPVFDLTRALTPGDEDFMGKCFHGLEHLFEMRYVDKGLLYEGMGEYMRRAR